jgi:choline dehydrogenase
VTDYDYVVVGGGTAGCVLAARLSQDPAARVLLLEAGGAEPGGAGGDPAGWPQLIGSDADWGGLTVPQAAAGPVAYPRGRVLGGSGAINAMAHIRGHHGVYDAWADGGADGWGYASLLPYFKRSEDTGKERHLELRGTRGPIRVAPVPEASRHPVAQAFATALCALGYPVTEDLSGSRQEGVAWPDLPSPTGTGSAPQAPTCARRCTARTLLSEPGPWPPASSSKAAGAPAWPTSATVPWSRRTPPRR